MVRGAVRHVRRGAGQCDFKFASDVSADQTTEIERMEKMLAHRRRSGAPVIRPPAPLLIHSHPERSFAHETSTSLHRRSGARWIAFPLASLSLAVALQSAGCASSTATSGAAMPAAPAPAAPAAPGHAGPADRPPSPDPRVGLKAGLWDAGEAAWNLKVVSKTPPSEKFVGVTNSDLAFTGKYAIQGNYNGYQVWDISNPAQADADDGVSLPGVAERRLGLQEPALRLGRRTTRRASTAACRACRRR